MRRIVINGAILLRGWSGIPRLTTHLAEALKALPDTRVEIVKPTSSRSRSSWMNAARDTWWDLVGAERAAGAADVFLSPCNIGGARRIPHVLNVADVMPIENPEYFDRKFGAYFRALVPYAVRRATRITTHSDYVRRRLLELAPRADVHILPLPGSRVPRAQVPYPTGAKHVLVLGVTEPHKNQVAAIRAVELLRNRTGEDIRLDLVGAQGRAEEEVMSTIARAESGGSWASRHIGVPDLELDRLFGSSWLLLQPSMNEGYGLPLVEAAEHGLPAIHSGRGAMPEISPHGNANGTDPEQLAQSMTALLEASVWMRHAAAARTTARERSWSAFQSALHQIVEPLLRNPPTV